MRDMGGRTTSGWAMGGALWGTLLGATGYEGATSVYCIAKSLGGLHFGQLHGDFTARDFTHCLSRSGIILASLASKLLAALLITSSSPLSSQCFFEHLQATASQDSAPQVWALATELTLIRQAVRRPILKCVFFMRFYLFATLSFANPCMVRDGEPRSLRTLIRTWLVKPYAFDRSGRHGFSRTSVTRDKSYRAYPLSTPEDGVREPLPSEAERRRPSGELLKIKTKNRRAYAQRCEAFWTSKCSWFREKPGACQRPLLRIRFLTKPAS